MKTLLQLTLCSILLASSAMAEHKQRGQKKNHKGPKFGKLLRSKHGACAKVQLTQDQKQEVKDVIFDFRAQKIDLKAAVQHARLDYKKLVQGESSSMAEAMAAADKIVTASTAMKALTLETKSKILFEVVNSKQRKAAARCIKGKKKGKKQGMGQRRGRGQRRGQKKS